MKATNQHVLSLLAAAALAVASSTASAQLAGASAAADGASASAPAANGPAAPARKAPRAGRARTASASFYAAPAPASSPAQAPVSSLYAQVPAERSTSVTAAPQAAASAPPAYTSVVVSSSNGGPATNACIPDCRSGFVCREGECVSACNPGCGEGETCNAKRECVPAAEATESKGAAYDKIRFGAGGHFGVGTSTDGTGTSYGGHIMLAAPLGGHFYTREDLVASYYSTNAQDSQYIGGGVSPYGSTDIEQEYLLIALRATAGYQIGNYVGFRAGVLLGSHTLTADHGFCGTGPQEQSFSSFAAGGTAALSFALKHIDISVTGDVYQAETQAICGVIAGPFAATQPATLVAKKDVAAQFAAQATILF